MLYHEHIFKKKFLNREELPEGFEPKTQHVGIHESRMKSVSHLRHYNMRY